VKEFVRRFFDNMTNPPEPGPELIPKAWRVPFFVGLVAVSLIALALVVRYVVVPGIGEQQSGSASVPSSARPQ